MTRSTPTCLAAAAAILAPLASSAQQEAAFEAVAAGEPDAWQEVEVTEYFQQETPEEIATRMEWFEDARFGMFIHWGLYSEAGGRFPGRDEIDNATREWIQARLDIPAAEYRSELLPRFNPVDYDPEAWAELAASAGMEYLIITSRHHDGFALWPSAYSDFDIESAPHGEDLLEPLAEATREQGLHFGLYYSILDWGHPQYGTVRNYRANHPDAGGEPDMEAYTAFMKNQLLELQQRYNPAVFWFDGEWEEAWNHEAGVDLYNYCRSLDPAKLINNRVDKGRNGMAGMSSANFAGDFGTPEQEIPATGFGPNIYWESCMTINTTWGFAYNDEDWKSTEQLLNNLVDIVSKGGNYLLNIGPDGKGNIPEASVVRLREIGAWMEVNGEAIRGTRANPFKSIDFDGRITVKDREDGGSTMYCHLFAWPQNGTITLPALPGGLSASGARLLDEPDQALEFATGEDGALQLVLGDSAPTELVPVVAIEFDTSLPIAEGEELVVEGEGIDSNTASGQ